MSRKIWLSWLLAAGSLCGFFGVWALAQNVKTQGTNNVGGGGGGAGSVTTAVTLTAGQLVVGEGLSTIGVGNLSGDASTAGSTAVTLATVNGAPGTCGDSTHVCQVVTNGKGLTTGQTAVAITATVTNASALSSGQLVIGQGGNGVGVGNLSGDVSTSGGTATVLATVNAGPGSCGDATHVCVVVTNGKGLVISQTAVAITAGSSPSFSALTSGTNNSAAMVVGAGSSLTSSGGSITATSLGGTFAAHTWLGNPTGSTSGFTTNTIGTSDTSVNWYGSTTGTATAYTVTLGQPATNYTSGLVVSFTPNVANSGGGPTLALNTLGAGKTITKCGTAALVANDLTTTAVAQVVYDGTEFQLLNPQAAACGSSSSSALTQIQQIVTTAGQTSVTFSSIPSTYSNLQFKVLGKSAYTGSAGPDQGLFQLNGDTGGNYFTNTMVAVNGSVTGGGGGSNTETGGLAGAFITNDGISPPAQYVSTITIDMIGYANTTFASKSVQVSSSAQNGSGFSHFPYLDLENSYWNNSSAITSVKFFLTSGAAFATSSVFTLYAFQ